MEETITTNTFTMPTGTRGRSRSPSRDRSRNRSRSLDSRSYDSRSYTDYSDEFYSDEDSRTDRGQTAKTSATRKAPLGKTGAARGKPNAGKPLGGKGAPKGKPAQSTKDRDYVTHRVLSARRLKINELRNENEDLKTQLVEVVRENKLLMRTANQQDKKLHQYEDQECDLPRIIAKHNEEMRSTKEQLRRQKEKAMKVEQRLKETDEDLNRTQRSLKKMKILVEDKKLDERDSLARKLSRVEADNEDKDKRVRDLEKHIENLQKNHKHELGIERARHREAQKDTLAVREQVAQLQHALKDVRRDLDINNIYANRGLKAGRSSTRTSNISSPAPSQRSNHFRKNSQDSGMTPREKAKHFEAQRREQERQNREERVSRLSEEPQPTVEDTPYEPQVQQSRRVGEPENFPPVDEPDWLTTSLKNNCVQEREAELAREEELADQRAFQEERDRRKREAEERVRQDQESERRARETQEREERERREREEMERREREQREREREQKEREEREQRDLEDIERRAREERDRIANDERTRAQQRQKASLLAKMKALEKDQEAANVILNDPFAVNTSPTKPPPRKPVDDIFDDPFSVPSSYKDEAKTYVVEGSARRRGQHESPKHQRGSKQNYSFGKPIENLHNGMPSHDVSVPVLERRKRNSLFDEDSDGDGYGGYQPTFTSNNSAGKQKAVSGSTTKAKKNLMNDLFGGSSAMTATRNMDDGNIFGESQKPSTNANRRRPGGNIQDTFGGEDPPKSNSHLLPRRGRQPTTTFNSPAINAVDTFDDDIEEVVL